jgi:ribosomal protein L31
MTHSNVHPLSSNDVFFDSWNESYIVQSTMWDNLVTWFFGITTGGRRLDRDMVVDVCGSGHQQPHLPYQDDNGLPTHNL